MINKKYIALCVSAMLLAGCSKSSDDTQQVQDTINDTSAIEESTADQASEESIPSNLNTSDYEPLTHDMLRALYFAHKPTPMPKETMLALFSAEYNSEPDAFKRKDIENKILPGIQDTLDEYAHKTAFTVTDHSGPKFTYKKNDCSEPDVIVEDKPFPEYKYHDIPPSPGLDVEAMFDSKGKTKKRCNINKPVAVHSADSTEPSTYMEGNTQVTVGVSSMFTGVSGIGAYDFERKGFALLGVGGQNCIREEQGTKNQQGFRVQYFAEYDPQEVCFIPVSDEAIARDIESDKRNYSVDTTAYITLAGGEQALQGTVVGVDLSIRRLPTTKQLDTFGTVVAEQSYRF